MPLQGDEVLEAAKLAESLGLIEMKGDSFKLTDKGVQVAAFFFSMLDVIKGMTDAD